MNKQELITAFKKNRLVTEPKMTGFIENASNDIETVEDKLFTVDVKMASYNMPDVTRPMTFRIRRFRQGGWTFYRMFAQVPTISTEARGFQQQEVLICDENDFPELAAINYEFANIDIEPITRLYETNMAGSWAKMFYNTSGEFPYLTINNDGIKFVVPETSNVNFPPDDGTMFRNTAVFAQWQRSLAFHNPLT